MAKKKPNPYTAITKVRQPGQNENQAIVAAVDRQRAPKARKKGK